MFYNYPTLPPRPTKLRYLMVILKSPNCPFPRINGKVVTYIFFGGRITKRGGGGGKTP